MSVPRVTLAGPGATIVARCAGSPGQQCTGTIAGATIEHLSAGRLVSITSAARSAAKKAKLTIRRVKVVDRSYSVPSGASQRISLSLTRAGRTLLDTFYRVPVALSITNGPARSARRVTFRYAIIDAPIDYYWKYTPRYTFIGHLLAKQLPSSYHVSLSCHGGGCPLRHAAVTIHGGVATATPALKGAHLRTGAVVQLTVSARNAVAEVLRFTIASNRLPETTALCQTPDQRAPAACYR